MKLEHTFTIPVGADEAWRVLRDIERVAPCMPGATVDSVDGDEFTGRVKVKVGPMQITYKGKAAFVDVDDDAHTAKIEARGSETRGSGTANATISAALHEEGDDTRVEVVTDLNVTGKPAQFGRGVMADVGEKLLGQFADCLAQELTGRPEAETEVAAAAPGQTAEAARPASQPPAAGAPGGEAAGGMTPASPPPPGPPPPPSAPLPPPSRPRPTQEAIDLFEVAGGSVAKRVGPALAGVIALLLVVWLIRRRNR